MDASPRFPELRHYSVEYRLPLAAVLALAAALVTPYASWAGLACLVGFLILAVPMLLVEMDNARRRRCWLRSFPSQLRTGDLPALVRGHPGRYRLHARIYRGFGMNAIRPAALVEDTVEGHFFPLVSAWKDVTDLAESLSLPLQHH